jgi:hypothetical protein
MSDAAMSSAHHDLARAKDILGGDERAQGVGRASAADTLRTA